MEGVTHRPQFSVSSDVSTGIKISITAIAVIEIFIPEK
jgi:hypothetical protein